MKEHLGIVPRRSDTIPTHKSGKARIEGPMRRP
jgi:hypothetical protein